VRLVVPALWEIYHNTLKSVTRHFTGGMLSALVGSSKYVYVYFMPRVSIVPPTDEWARMPTPKGRLCGLSRTTLLELRRLGHIKMAVIRKPGAVKGIRLIYLPSLYGYLDDLAKAEKP
jgi:hypothetical protein